MIKHYIVACIVLALIGCKTGYIRLGQNYRDNIPVIAFCDLPQYTGKQVYLKCTYSGVDEYWSLHDPEKKKCTPELLVDLQFAGSNPHLGSKKFAKAFAAARQNEQNSYLMIEAVGTFENNNKNGYGHLGSNNARFLVSELITIALLKK